MAMLLLNLSLSSGLKLRVNEYWQDMEKREPLFSADGNVSWCSLYGKQYEAPHKIKNGTPV